MISHKASSEQLCGDKGDLFPNAYTNEKVYILKSGIKFGRYTVKCIVISKSLYGLFSSSNMFHSQISDTLRSFGFSQTSF